MLVSKNLSLSGPSLGVKTINDYKTGTRQKKKFDKIKEEVIHYLIWYLG